MDIRNKDRADSALTPLRGRQASNTRWLPTSTLLSVLTSSIYLFCRSINVVFAEQADPRVWAALFIEIIAASTAYGLVLQGFHIC